LAETRVVRAPPRDRLRDVRQGRQCDLHLVSRNEALFNLERGQSCGLGARTSKVSPPVSRARAVREVFVSCRRAVRHRSGRPTDGRP
jgi:hypothetical protein